MKLSEILKLLSEDVDLRFKVSLRQTVSAGRGLFAEDEVAVGEDILLEDPLVVGPGPGEVTSCTACLADGSLQLCRNCFLLPVCKDESSHRRDLDLHLTECALLCESRNLPQAAGLFKCSQSEWLLPLRVLLLEKKKRSKFFTLQGHPTEQTISSEVSRALSIVTESPVATSDLTEISGILSANAFRCDRYGNRAVFALASMVNHDCRPNCRVFFDSAMRLHLRTKRDINPEEELTISYCSPLLSTPQRLAKLRRSKAFSCSCRRCLDPTEFGSFMNAVTCPKCSSLVVFHFKSKDYKCIKCSFATTTQQVDKLLEAAERAHKKSCTSVTRAEEMLGKHKEKIAPTHALLLELKAQMIDLYQKARKPCDLATYDRRIELLRERLNTLAMVDDGASRLRGFLLFRLHCLLVKKLAMMRRTESPDLEKAIIEHSSELRESLRVSLEILRDDRACPPELYASTTLYFPCDT